MSKWIKCSERMPKENEIVRVSFIREELFGNRSTEIMIGTYSKGRWWMGYHPEFLMAPWVGCTVTHWMPFPEPPEVK